MPPLADDHQLRLVCFWVDDDLYGIDIMRVREVILPKRQHAELAMIRENGIVSVRGRALSLYSLRDHLGYEPCPESGEGCLVVTSVKGQEQALVADKPDQVRLVSPDSAVPPPRELASLPLLALVSTQHRVIRVLDVDRLTGQVSRRRIESAI